MKKGKLLILVLIGMMILPSVLSLTLTTEKLSSNEVMFPEINKPAIMQMKISNLGSSTSLEFYNLMGFKMSPFGTVPIEAGETKIIDVGIYPKEGFNYRGFYTFPYYIRGGDGTEIEQKMTVKLVNLEDAFEIGSGDVYPDSNSMDIYIHNKENFNFQQINARFTSPFFEFDKDFELAPYQRVNFNVQVNREDFSKLMAGEYQLNSEITIDDKKTNVQGKINFAEKDLTTTVKKEYGFVVYTRKISTVNNGNVISNISTTVKKNIISRLFTTVSPEPNKVERDGIDVYYIWSRSVNPGENLDIIVKTNWLFPFLIIIVLVVIVVFTKQYSQGNLILTKRVSFVNTKGGKGEELALKVSITVKANKYIEKVNIIDKIPALASVYEKFGGERPTKIDEKGKKLEWYFERLQPGEVRVISYIIYSKVGVFGKFELPAATCIYERDGNINETASNRAYFLAEPKRNN